MIVEIGVLPVGGGLDDGGGALGRIAGLEDTGCPNEQAREDIRTLRQQQLLQQNR